MNSLTLPAFPIDKAAGPVPYLPVVSMILPFEPKMVSKAEIVDQLKTALEVVHRHVAKSHQNEMTALVMQKLRKVVRNLNFMTYTRSVAIFISPLLEKVLYLDMAVEQRIVVNEPLDIRAVVFARKQSRQYLLMQITEYSSNIYLGNEDKLTKIKSNMPSGAARQVAPVTKREDSSDPRLSNIVRSSEEGLAAILEAYPLPVFIVGSRRAVNRFKLNTSIQPGILQFTCTSDDVTTIEALAGIIKPIISDWENLKKTYLLQQLDYAKNSQALATGIGNVWKMASKWSGSLLVVEENYKHNEELLESEDGLYTSKEPYSKYSHIRNATDHIIELVLENKGDVEFVEKGFLKNFKDIALICKDTPGKRLPY